MRTTRSNGYRTAIVRGAELAYVEEGSGEPVVFVHGGISDLTIWKHQLPAFSDSYRAIAYSRRYAWPNEPIPDGLDDQIIPHADDLADFLRSIDAAPAHLVGNSWGAFICLFTALRHPELVRSLTLEEPPVIPLFVSTPPRPSELLKALLTRPATGFALLGMMLKGFIPATIAAKQGKVEKSIRIFVTKVAIGEKAYENLVSEVKEHMLLNAGTHAAQFLGKGFPEFSDEQVRGIQHPTLLVGGENSPILFTKLNDRLQQLLPQVERVVIPKASHVMHYDNPQATNNAIRTFLGRVPVPTASTAQ